MEVPRAVVVAVAAAPLAAEAMEAGVMEGSRAAVLMVAQVRAEGTLVAVGWKVAETAAENKAEERVEGEMVEEAWVGAETAAKAMAAAVTVAMEAAKEGTCVQVGQAAVMAGRVVETWVAEAMEMVLVGAGAMEVAAVAGAMVARRVGSGG